MDNIEELISKIKSGDQFSYLYFWGHKTNEKITKSCFSQWYPSSFVLDGKTYATAEHYMMAEKARLFMDFDMEQKILDSSDPSTAKAMGRKVRNFNNDIWNQKCFDIVVKGNTAKFTQNVELKNVLVATGNQILAEASPLDTIWGIGLSENSEEAKNPLLWKGKNLLGFALMKVREAVSSNTLNAESM
jgi:ribA/ribD-fused uncharacterized protein